MYKNIFKLQTCNIYITHQRFRFETQLVSVPCEWFSLCGLLRRLHGVVVWEYDIIFNTKCFIIYSKISSLCNRNRSVVLAYIWRHTHTSSCRRESDDDRDTHTQIHVYHWSYVCTNTHTHILGRASYSTSRRASITHKRK